ncbi:MAG: ATP-binding protein [Gammaproteobacteria bacterium]|nr:ATP-binding protein [Gammaproteobacteria bacterium]
MDRHQLTELRNWLDAPGRKPLIIRGARQVGKSTLVELFAKAEERDLSVVNLERHRDLAEVFASNDPAAILNLIDTVAEAPLSDRGILFLDEIQSAPPAIAALRYFFEELPGQPVIAAGSLVDFALADRPYPIPVGRVEYLNMGPMTFTEFLAATHNVGLAAFIHAFEWPPRMDVSVPSAIHERLLAQLRVYQFVGGMPEAVRVYADSASLQAVNNVHTGIIDTYRDDFPKYAPRRDMTRMLRVFNFAARQPGRKVKYSNVSPDDQSATIRHDIDLLAMARVVAKVTHSACSGLPLQADLKDNVFKLVFLDVGLMNAICGVGWETLARRSGTELVNAGTTAEQFIGQHLQYLVAHRPNRELTYWLREGRANNAEVDYVLELAGEMIPLEVKAGRAGALKSLHQFMAEKRAPLAVRFDASPASVQEVETEVRSKDRTQRVRYRLLSLPLYLVERLPDLVAAELASV